MYQDISQGTKGKFTTSTMGGESMNEATLNYTLETVKRFAQEFPDFFTLEIRHNACLVMEWHDPHLEGNYYWEITNHCIHPNAPAKNPRFIVRLRRDQSNYRVFVRTNAMTLDDFIADVKKDMEERCVKNV